MPFATCSAKSADPSRIQSWFSSSSLWKAIHRRRNFERQRSERSTGTYKTSTSSRNASWPEACSCSELAGERVASKRAGELDALRSTRHHRWTHRELESKVSHQYLLGHRKPDDQHGRAGSLRQSIEHQKPSFGAVVFTGPIRIAIIDPCRSNQGTCHGDSQPPVGVVVFAARRDSQADTIRNPKQNGAR